MLVTPCIAPTFSLHTNALLPPLPKCHLLDNGSYDEVNFLSDESTDMSLFKAQMTLNWELLLSKRGNRALVSC